MPASKAGLLIQKELSAGDEFAILALTRILAPATHAARERAIARVLVRVPTPSFSTLIVRASRLAK